MVKDTIVFDFDGTLFDLNVDWSQEDTEQAELIGLGENVLPPEVETILKKIQENYFLAIYSRNHMRTIFKAIEHLDNIHIQVVGKELCKKPDPWGMRDIYNSHEGTNLVMVGDTYHDIQAARQYGCLCIILRNLKLDYIPAGADYYIDSLEELPELLGKINDTNK